MQKNIHYRKLLHLLLVTFTSSIIIELIAGEKKVSVISIIDSKMQEQINQLFFKACRDNKAIDIYLDRISSIDITNKDGQTGLYIICKTNDCMQSETWAKINFLITKGACLTKKCKKKSSLQILQRFLHKNKFKKEEFLYDIMLVAPHLVMQWMKDDSTISLNYTFLNSLPSHYEKSFSYRVMKIVNSEKKRFFVEGSFLHMAVISKNKDLLRFLVEKNIDLTIQSSQGETVFHELTMDILKDCEWIVDILSKHTYFDRSKIFSLKNNKNVTALQKCCSKGNAQLAKKLIDVGAEPDARCVIAAMINHCSELENLLEEKMPFFTGEGKIELALCSLLEEKHNQVKKETVTKEKKNKTKQSIKSEIICTQKEESKEIEVAKSVSSWAMIASIHSRVNHMEPYNPLKSIISFSDHVEKKRKNAADLFHSFPRDIEYTIGHLAQSEVLEVDNKNKPLTIKYTIPHSMPLFGYKRKEGMYEFIIKRGECIHRFFRPNKKNK